MEMPIQVSNVYTKILPSIIWKFMVKIFALHKLLIKKKTERIVLTCHFHGKQVFNYILKYANSASLFLRCIQQGASLVSIHSKGEMDLIKSVTENYPYNLWTGLIMQSDGEICFLFLY